MRVLDQTVDHVIARGVQRRAGVAPVWASRPAGSSYTTGLESASTITGWGFYAGTPGASFNRLTIPFQATQSEYVPTTMLVRIRHTNSAGAILAAVKVPLAPALSTENIAEVDLGVTITTAQPIWIELVCDGRVQFYTLNNGGAAIYPTPTFPQTGYWTDINQSNPGSAAPSGSQRLIVFEAWMDDGSTPTRSVSSDLAGDLERTGWLGRVVSVHPSLIETASIGTLVFTRNVSSSTFSGWGWYPGNQATAFNAVAVFLNAYDSGNVPAHGKMRVRQMPANTALWATDNPAAWPVIAESKVIQLGLTFNAWRQVVFPLNKEVAGNVWVEFVTTGHVSMATNTGGTVSPVVAAPPKTAYITGGRLANPVAWSAVSTHYTPHCRLGTYDYRGGRIVARTEFSSQISGGGSSSSNPVVYIALPTNPQNILPALEGRELNVYFDDCIWSSVPLSELCIDVTCTKGSQFARWWRYNPTSGDAGTTTFTISVYTKDRAALLASAVATLKTVALSHPTVAVSRKVLMIGDSTWANGIVAAELVNLFNADAKYFLTLVGSNDGSANDAGGTPRTIKTDAISGWSFSLFTTNSATAWTELGGTARTGSPFSFAGAFSFASYLAAHSITMSSGDWVLVHLGINDVFSFTDDATANTQILNMLGQLAAWITSIKAAVSGVRIGICVTIPPSSSQDAFGVNYNNGQTLRRYEQNLRLWRDAVIAAYDSTVASNVYVIPYHVNLDRENNFPTSSVALNARNSDTYNQPSNGVHPANSGYWQLADMLRGFLKAIEP